MRPPPDGKSCIFHHVPAMKNSGENTQNPGLSSSFEKPLTIQSAAPSVDRTSVCTIDRTLPVTGSSWCCCRAARASRDVTEPLSEPMYSRAVRLCAPSIGTLVVAAVAVAAVAAVVVAADADADIFGHAG